MTKSLMDLTIETWKDYQVVIIGGNFKDNANAQELLEEKKEGEKKQIGKSKTYVKKPEMLFTTGHATKLNYDNWQEHLKEHHHIFSIRTGKAGGYTGMDIDTFSDYDNLIMQFPEMKQCYTEKTKKGYHLWFQYDERFPNMKKCLKGFPDIELKNDNTQLTCFPTRYNIDKLDGTIEKFKIKKHRGDLLYKLSEKTLSELVNLIMVEKKDVKKSAKINSINKKLTQKFFDYMSIVLKKVKLSHEEYIIYEYAHKRICGEGYGEEFIDCVNQFEGYEKKTIAEYNTPLDTKEHGYGWGSIYMLALKYADIEKRELDLKYDMKFDKLHFNAIKPKKSEELIQAEELIEKSMEKIKTTETKRCRVVNEIRELTNERKTADASLRKQLGREIAELNDKLTVYNERTHELKNVIKHNKATVKELSKDNTEEEYKLKKEYFERFHFKIDKPKVFYMVECKIEDIDENLYSYEAKQFTEYLREFQLSDGTLFVSKWMNDPYKRNYSVIDMNFDKDYNVKDVYNMFKGFVYETHEYGETTEEEIIEGKKIIDEQLRVLCNFEEPAFEWFKKTFAYRIQKPNELPGTSVLIKGEQGTGKNLTIEAFMRYIFGEEHMKQSEHIDSLVGNWSDSIRYKFGIIIDELSGKDGFEFSEAIKNLITQEKIEIRTRYIGGKTCRNFAWTFIFSNKDTPIQIEPSDRRFVVFEASSKYIGNTSYYSKLAKVLHNKDIMKSYAEDLKKMNIIDFEPSSKEDRPITNAYLKIQSQSIPLPIVFFHSFVHFEQTKPRFIDDDGKMDNILDYSVSELYNEFIEWKNRNGHNKYEMNAQKFGRYCSMLELHRNIKKNKITKKAENRYEIDMDMLEEKLKTKYKALYIDCQELLE